jgi:hypothetical protein
VPHPADEGDDIYTPRPSSNPVVDALKAEGLHKSGWRLLHSVTCPWAAEHSEGASYEAYYTEADAENPIGKFWCTHVHARRRDATSLIEHLRLAPEVARAKPRIRVVPGELHRVVSRAEQLLAADGTFFHAGGPIIRVVVRPNGAVATEEVNEHTLSAVLGSKCDWERQSGTDKRVRCDPPPDVVRGVIRRQDREHLLMLAALARQPFYGPDHRLITAPGYNAETGIYAAHSGDYALDELTRDQAKASLGYLKWLLGEFPFESRADMSAAVGAILTAATRPSLPQAPAFNINATLSGSGKSYLAKLLASVAGPGDPYSVSYPTSSEEATKVVLAMLLEKPAVILFDDMQTDWVPFGALNKALTSPTITERVLGSSRTATANTNVLFLGTGNNVNPVADMRRRVVSIRLAPHEEAPALRQFRSDRPLDHIRKDRTRVLEAAFTIIGSYQAASSPRADVPPIGTFEDWDMLCRQPLLWLGEPDPATSLIDQLTDDDEQDLLGEFLAVWYLKLGPSPVTVRTIMAKADDCLDLKDILSELNLIEVNPRSNGKLGWYLKKNLGRRSNGLRIERGPVTERRTWKLVGPGPTTEPELRPRRRAVAGH